MNIRSTVVLVLVVLLNAVVVFSQQPATNAGSGVTPVSVRKYEWKPNYSAPSAPEGTVDPNVYPQFPHQDYSGQILRTPPTPDYIKVDPVLGGGGRYDRMPPRTSVPVRPEDQAALPSSNIGEKRTINANLDLLNTSSQSIVAVEADYVFFDSASKEYMRYRLSESGTVRPNDVLKIRRKVSVKDMAKFSGNPGPALIFDVSPAKIDVVLVSVTFADGTVWKAK